MRFRLLRRRLTISAPRVIVRSALPWPVRWLAVAFVLGGCAAVSLWTFEFGKSIAGLDSGARDELVRLRAEVTELREAQGCQQALVNTSQSLQTAEQAAMDRLMVQVRQLETENRALRDDLGFFEKLLPAARNEGLAIRALQAEVLGGAQLRWQVLVMQPARNAPEFNGRLELVLVGTSHGKPWSETRAAEAQPLRLRQYRRLEGSLALPAGAVVKTVTARVLEGAKVRATHTLAIDEPR
jgi:hypothetical protein